MAIIETVTKRRGASVIFDISIDIYGIDQITDVRVTILDSARPETMFQSAKWQDGYYAALAVRLINQ